MHHRPGSRNTSILSRTGYAQTMDMDHARMPNDRNNVWMPATRPRIHQRVRFRAPRTCRDRYRLGSCPIISSGSRRHAAWVGVILFLVPCELIRDGVLHGVGDRGKDKHAHLRYTKFPGGIAWCVCLFRCAHCLQLFMQKVLICTARSFYRQRRASASIS